LKRVLSSSLALFIVRKKLFLFTIFINIIFIKIRGEIRIDYKATAYG